MPFVRRDVDEIPRPHLQRLVVSLKHQLRPSFQHENPFALVLIVPEAFGTGVAVGDDAFNTDGIGFYQNFGLVLSRVVF